MRVTDLTTDGEEKDYFDKDFYDAPIEVVEQSLDWLTREQDDVGTLISELARKLDEAKARQIRLKNYERKLLLCHFSRTKTKVRAIREGSWP